MLDLGLSARSGEDGGHLAAALDVQRRISERLSGFATARAGVMWRDDETGPFVTALGGLRWRW